VNLVQARTHADPCQNRYISKSFLINVEQIVSKVLIVFEQVLIPKKAPQSQNLTYFRWRTSPIGCEIYWHGLNDYANTENRRLKELKEISGVVSKLECVRGTRYKARIAVLKDYSNVWDAASDCCHDRVDYYRGVICVNADVKMYVFGG